MAKANKHEEGFRVKLKHFLGIGSGKGPHIHAGNIRPHPREFFFTPEIIKDISPGTPANHRMKSIRDLYEVVQTKRLEDNAVEVLWTAIQDLLLPTVAREDRVIALRFLQHLIEGQYEQLGVMRAHFFRVIRGYNVFEDLALRLELFRTLSCDGKDLLYFEEEAGGFLLEWMKDVISSSCIAQYLALLINVVKFNAAYLDEDVTIGLVFNTCLIATRSGREHDIELCLELLDTVICYSYLPAPALHQFILCLCRVVNIEKFCQSSWLLMRKLLGTHLGHSGIYRMCCILQDKNNFSESGAILLRGAVFFIGMALWGSKKVTSLKHPPSAVLPSFLQALVKSNSSIVAYEIVLSVQRLVSKYGRDQQIVTWDTILDIVEALLKHVESTPKANPMLVSNIHDLLTCIEELTEQGQFHSSPDRFFSIIETCANKRPETSILALVSHKARAVHPSKEGWIQSLYDLVDKYFKHEGRTKIRNKVLDILSDVLSANRMLHEDELIEMVVLPHVQHIESDADVEVKKRAAHLLVDLAQTSTSTHCLDILALLQKIINHPFSQSAPTSPAQVTEGSDMPVRLSSKLDDVMVAVTGLIGVFQCKLYQQPNSHALRIYEILVGHLESHYTHEHMLRKGGKIREAIFTFLMALRGDGLFRLGLPSKSRQSQICYSPYVLCAYKPDHCERRPSADASPGVVRNSPCVGQSKTVVVPYAQAFKCIRTCLDQENDWRVLEVVLPKLPEVLHNKTLLLAAYVEDIDRFCLRLCDMVSNKNPALPMQYHNKPPKFQKSDFHSHIFPVLTCLVSYHTVLERSRQTELLRCLEFGLVSRKALICVRALTVCALEMQDIMRRQLPAVLLRLSQISATVAMAIPLMEFLSSLIRLPKLYANFVEEQYMSVFAIALPYTNPFKYNHYTVSLAYHVIAMWFLKCKLPFRKRFVGFIVKGLRANVLRQFEETSVIRARQNQDSSDRNRTHSLNDDTLKKDRFRAFSMNDERLRNQGQSNKKHRGSWDLSYPAALSTAMQPDVTTKAAAARAKAQGLAAAQLAAANAAPQSPGSSQNPSVEDMAKMQFHKELMETCIDALARYTFSTCASMPRRTPVTDFLLAGGQNQSWLLGNRIITITTSGGAKMTKSGLCENCLAMARSQAVSKVPEENLESPSGGRKRHKSAAVRSQTKAVSLKPASQDDILLHKHSPDGSSESELSTQSDTSLAFTASNEATNTTADVAVGRRVSVGNREEKMQLVDNVLMGLKAKPTDKSIFSPHLCNCWCTQWAEIHIRRATGNLSWMMRIQNTQDLVEAFPEFPLDDISNLFMNPPEDTYDKLNARRKIDSMSLADTEYDSLLEEHFSEGGLPSAGSESGQLPALEGSPTEKQDDAMACMNGKMESEDGEGLPVARRCSFPDLDPVVEEFTHSMSNGKDLDSEEAIQHSALAHKETPAQRSRSAEEMKSDRSDIKLQFQSRSESEQLAVSVKIEETELAPPMSPAPGSSVGSPSSQPDSRSPGASSRESARPVDTHSPLVSPRAADKNAERSGSSVPCSPRPGQPSGSGRSSLPGMSTSGKPSSPTGLSLPRSRHSSNPEPSSPPAMKLRHSSIPESVSPVITPERERSHTVAVSSPQRQMMRTTSLPMEPRRPGSFDAGFPASANTTPTKAPHGGVSPAFLFLQLYHSSLLDSGPGRPLELARTPMVERAVKMLDLMYPYETHKIGVVYVGPGQATNETAILSNHHGSARYVEFLQGLGHLIRLSECKQDTIYVGGLDVKGNDGQFAYAWHDDFMQVIYHVATLMPNKDSDPHCNAKKLHIGNDYVSIVYNDSGESYQIGTIKCQFNYVSIIVTPLDHETSAVDVQTRKGSAYAVLNHCFSAMEGKDYSETCLERPHVRAVALDRWSLFTDIQDVIGHTETKIISDSNVALLVRQMAVHANLASVILQRQQTQPQDPYASNWLERLRQIKRVRQKVVQDNEKSTEKQQAGTPIAEDFTDFV